MAQQNVTYNTSAQIEDRSNPADSFRDQFIIPTKTDLSRGTIARGNESEDRESQSCTYLCGNSLGLQPVLTRKYFDEYLSTWSQKGVFGHFKPVSDSHLAPWLHVDDDVRADMAAIVGAKEEEVAVMQTLTANLHLLMCSFYRPTPDRRKILIEGKAFPSDHFAVESQLRMHSYDPADSLILLEPPSPPSLIIPTEYILKTIDAHASELALILLPGIQYYTGQFFDIATITAHAHSKGITIGWDLAHAAGNVPLELHAWDVDFAAWCTYKYLNCGPGSIGACFVHERHGRVTTTTTGSSGQSSYRPRLAGWWGSQKTTRFQMANVFTPIPGAAGFELSNPSVADTTAVRASLDVFKQTSVAVLRARSLRLTGDLEARLDALAAEQEKEGGRSGALFEIITPRDPEQRGAQLSLLLRPGLLEEVMRVLEAEGVVVDERRPDVIRVAPAPLYNTFEDVARFVEIFAKACEVAVEAAGEKSGESRPDPVGVHGGQGEKGWSEIK